MIKRANALWATLMVAPIVFILVSVSTVGEAGRGLGGLDTGFLILLVIVSVADVVLIFYTPNKSALLSFSYEARPPEPNLQTSVNGISSVRINRRVRPRPHLAFGITDLHRGILFSLMVTANLGQNPIRCKPQRISLMSEPALSSLAIRMINTLSFRFAR